MVFTSISLAKRLETAEASLVEAFARATQKTRQKADVYISRLGGGVGVYAGDGSPFNKLAGLGFEALDDAALTAIERHYADRNLSLRAEVSTLADPALLIHLAERGYTLSGFENVLGLDLRTSALPRPADNVFIRRATADEERTWVDVVITGFLHPDEFDGPPPTESFERELLEDVFSTAADVGGVCKYLAWRGGIVAGGASLRISDGVAQLSGASTLYEHRRNGVQTSLLATRLRDAAAEGCDIAVVTTEPASKSQQNVQRQGFSLLYSRAVMVKRP